MARRKKSKPAKPTTSILTSQPTELVAAIREQVARRRVASDDPTLSISEWVGNACLAGLDAELAATVPDRLPRWGRRAVEKPA